MGLLGKFLDNASQTTTALGQVAERFSQGGCASINNAEDKKALQTFQELPSTIQIKVPGSGQLNTASQTCKLEM